VVKYSAIVSVSRRDLLVAEVLSDITGGYTKYCP
jgi:hypothetical protein